MDRSGTYNCAASFKQKPLVSPSSLSLFRPSVIICFRWTRAQTVDPKSIAGRSVGRSVTGADRRRSARVPTSFGCFQTGRIINSIKPRPRPRWVGLHVRYIEFVTIDSARAAPIYSTRFASRGKKNDWLHYRCIIVMRTRTSARKRSIKPLREKINVLSPPSLLVSFPLFSHDRLSVFTKSNRETFRALSIRRLWFRNLSPDDRWYMYEFASYHQVERQILFFFKAEIGKEIRHSMRWINT